MTSDMPTMRRFERRDLDVVVSYDDDSEYTITYDDLRHACPCAKCSPLRNLDDTSKTLRRQVEALADVCRRLCGYARRHNRNFRWN